MSSKSSGLFLAALVALRFDRPMHCIIDSDHLQLKSIGPPFSFNKDGLWLLTIPLAAEMTTVRLTMPPHTQRNNLETLYFNWTLNNFLKICCYKKKAKLRWQNLCIRCVYLVLSAVSWRSDLRGATNTQQVGYGDRTFAVAGSRLWISLPVHLCNPDIRWTVQMTAKKTTFSGSMNTALWLLICGALEKHLLTYLRSDV